MYTFLLADSEGVAAARVDDRPDPEQTARAAVDAIRSLDRAAYRGAGPRILLVAFDEEAGFFGPSERAQIFAANRDLVRPSIRLLVTRSSLQLAALRVVQMQVQLATATRTHNFGTLEQAHRFADAVRPGVGAVLASLGRRLADAPVSGARPVARAVTPAKAWMR